MRKPFAFFVFFTAIAVSFISFAQENTVPPETIEGATAFIPRMIQALVEGNFNVLGGFALMLLMVGVRQFAIPKWNLDTNVLPAVTALVSALSLVGLSITTGVAPLEAAKNGLVMAVFAGGAWSLFGKYVAKQILGDKYQSNN